MPIDVLAGMNDKQAVAVAHIDGPLLVVAGAGSGKTRVITHRIANLIQEAHVRPDHILAITFTNKAAGEMQERVGKLLGLHTPWISTFHSTGLRILKLEHEAVNLPEQFTILDADDQRTLLRALIKEAQAEEQTDARFVGWQISQWKNALKRPEDVQPGDDREDLVLTLYRRYRELMLNDHLLDFDDLLMLPVQLFSGNDELRKKYQDHFPYILIDEYQDTNAAQYQLIRLLGEHGNVCATGDPDQAIYGWRGADLNNILDFERDFPGCKTVLLEQNYRSTKLILKAAQSVVENNLKRKDKTIFTDNPEGRPLTLITVDDHLEEAKAIAIRCAALKEKHARSLGDMAVFYRTNSQSRVLEEEFIRRDIPYILIGGTRFYERREVKDVLAYLRLLVNPRDIISFERIVNTPARKIGKKTLGLIRERCADEGVGFHELFMQDELLERLAVGRNARILRDFSLFWRRFQRLDHGDASDCIAKIIEMTALDDHYRQREPGEVGEERVANIWELQTAAAERSIEEFLDHVALFTSTDLKHDTGDQVVMMTLHASKGLEFPVVFISGCEQGLLPLVHHGRDCDYEEERRLMYVGITRAMEELYLSRAVCRFQYGETKRNPPSMFLAEIPDECIEHRDCTGRVLPMNTGKVVEGPRYPQNSSANALLGGKVRGAGGKELLEKMQEGGLLQSGSALLAAVRAGSSATGSRDTKPKERGEPVILESDPYVPGDQVEHAVFGPGAVIECKGPADNRTIVIAFGDKKIKELALSFAAKHLSLAGSADDEDAPF